MKPSDEPMCGFDGEHCRKLDEQGSIIAAGTLAALLFCASVITLSIYRKWKIEQEIEGLLWKIDKSDVHGYISHDNMVSSPSKVLSFIIMFVYVAVFRMYGQCDVQH